MVQKVNLSMTEDIAEEINDVSVAVNAVADDLAALDDSLGTASERNVGDGAGLVPDTAVLNTRLGTSGNLGSIASEDATDYVSRAEFEGPTLVWSGSDSSPNMSELSEGGPGFYIVRDDSGADHSIYIRSTSNGAAGSSTISFVGSSSFRINVLEYTSSGDFRIEELFFSSGTTQLTLLLIDAVYKV